LNNKVHTYHVYMSPQPQTGEVVILILRHLKENQNL